MHRVYFDNLMKLISLDNDCIFHFIFDVIYRKPCFIHIKLVRKVIACRTGVIFCVFQANRGESEASAWRARVACEGRSAKKSRLSPYHCSSRSGVQIWTRLPNWLLWNTWSSNVFPRRNTITYSDLNTTDRFALKLFGEFNWKYGPMGLICSLLVFVCFRSCLLIAFLGQENSMSKI